MKKIIILLNLISSLAFTQEIKVAVLKYGSVNWELNVIEHHKLDIKYNIKIKKLQMTNKDAATIAFLSKSADIFVTDWIWVSKQRHKGNLFYFTPYSSAAGGLLVDNKSNINTIADLKDKKVGIAGSSLDKSWLLFRAYYINSTGEDPLTYFKSSFAAPPLINGLLINKQLDGAFNYWNYASVLKSKGFRQVIGIDEILPALGINSQLPLIGYVFRQSFEKKNAELLSNFIKASEEARLILEKSDIEWERIVNLTGAKNLNMLASLRDEFRKGIPNADISQVQDSIEKAYKILAEIGGKKLVGKQNELAAGTLWTGY